MFLSKRVFPFLLGVHLCLIAFWNPAARAEDRFRHVLILHSYHCGLEWTDGVMAGMREIFAGTPDLEIHLQVEYLDTKHHHEAEYLDQRLDEFLVYKLAGLHFDLVLVSDDDAFRFALRHRQDLFSGSPIVFCGVNQFDPALLDGKSGITGVEEVLSLKDTLAVALRLHPDTREIVFIGQTRNGSGRGVATELTRLAQGLPRDVTPTFWNDLPEQKILSGLQNLKPGTVVLFSQFLRNLEGRVLNTADTMELVRSASPVPIYGAWETMLGAGIVGGRLISSLHHGRLAARLGIRILRGESPDALPVIREESNSYMFDLRELKRFGISLDALPVGSTVINQDPSFYPMSKRKLWAGIALSCLLALTSAILLWNIRGRRRAESALRSSEERLRLALEGSQDAMWDWNVVTGSNIVDDQWCAMLGYTREEIEEDYRQWQSLVHPDDLPGITAAHRACMEGRTTHFAGEFRMRTKSGEWKWILGSGKVVARDPAGTPLRLTGTHKDISLQKEGEIELRRALADAQAGREKIDAILKSIIDGLIVTDMEGRVILMNHTAENLLGIEFHDALFRTAPDIVHNPGLLRYLEGSLTQETLLPLELEMMDPRRGEVRMIQVRTCPVQNVREKQIGLITIFQDVTTAREMDRLKSEFISTAAHELRTPLTSILGYAELLLREEEFPPSERQNFIEVIIRKADGLATIIDQLLDLSRIESGRLISLDRQPADIGPFVSQMAKQYRKIAPHHRFETVFPDQCTRLWVDQGKLGQVFENLLSNAVKYSPKGGSIRLVGKQMGNAFEISVEDQGCGMTPDQVERVFDKFYRADTSDTSMGGLGLGMAIVKNIVEAHGGVIRVESEPERGTRVCFSIPLGEPVPGATPPLSESAKASDLPL